MRCDSARLQATTPDNFPRANYSPVDSPTHNCSVAAAPSSPMPTRWSHHRQRTLGQPHMRWHKRSPTSATHALCRGVFAFPALSLICLPSVNHQETQTSKQESSKNQRKQHKNLQCLPPSVAKPNHSPSTTNAFINKRQQTDASYRQNHTTISFNHKNVAPTPGPNPVDAALPIVSSRDKTHDWPHQPKGADNKKTITIVFGRRPNTIIHYHTRRSASVLLHCPSRNNKTMPSGHRYKSQSPVASCLTPLVLLHRPPVQPACSVVRRYLTCCSCTE